MLYKFEAQHEHKMRSNKFYKTALQHHTPAHWEKHIYMRKKYTKYSFHFILFYFAPDDLQSSRYKYRYTVVEQVVSQQKYVSVAA